MHTVATLAAQLAVEMLACIHDSSGILPLPGLRPGEWCAQVPQSNMIYVICRTEYHEGNGTCCEASYSFFLQNSLKHYLFK